MIHGLHYLIAAIVTWCNNQFSPRFGDLPCLDASVENPFVGVRQSPGPAPGPTTIGTVSVGIQFSYIIATGFSHRATFFKIGLPKCLQGLSAVIAGVVISSRNIVNRFVELYFSASYIFKEKVENCCDFELFECFRIPFVQPRPGRKVCMASLGEEEYLTIQPPHVVNNSADNCFHCFIVT